MSSFRKLAMAEIANCAAEEFGETVTHIPMIREARSKQQPDPKRPAYDVCAVFDPNAEGSFSHTAELSPPSSLEAIKVPSSQPILMLRESAAKYRPSEKDIFIIEGRKYRVLFVAFDMPGVWQVHLEILGRNPLT